MKTITLISLVFFTITLLLVPACKDDDSGPTYPPRPFDLEAEADFDWVIYLYGIYGTGKEANLQLQIYWNGDTAFVEPDTISLLIDGEPYDLYHYTGSNIFSCTPLMEWGEVYHLKLQVNNVTKLNKDVKVCEYPDCTYPVTFDPQTAATMSWTLDNSNSYQYLTLSSGFYGAKDPVYSWEGFISGEARSHTFTANTLSGVDDADYFAITLYEINYLTEGKTCVYTMAGSWKQYVNTTESVPAFDFNPRRIADAFWEQHRR